MTWKRLEAGGVDPEMTEGIAARIADPLWLMARQWQVGEFKGEDAAMPLVITAEVASVPLDTVHPAHSQGAAGLPGHVVGGVPVEAVVEQEPITKGTASVRARLEDGAALARELTRAEVDLRVSRNFTRYFRLGVPASDDVSADGIRLRLLGYRALDGVKIRERLAVVGGDASRLLENEQIAIPAAMAAIISRWALSAPAYVEPAATEMVRTTEGSAWSDRRQEYSFGLSATARAGTIALTAEEYPGGTLDWYHFDRAEKLGQLDDARVRPNRRLNVLATPLQFAGMPAARFWEIEDSATYIGDLAGGPDDLARSVIAAYSAVAGDDWFVVPMSLPAGTLNRVTGLKVRDDFSPTPTGVSSVAENDATVLPHRPWRFFELGGDTSVADGHAPWLLLPQVAQGQDAPAPLELVLLRRDEMANMAWAIEKRLEGPLGLSLDVDRPAWPTPPETEEWGFEMMSQIPPGWLPLVPVRITGKSPQVVLRRGRVVTAKGEVDRTPARAQLLNPSGPFLLNEEEIPAGGVRVTRRAQMARGTDGLLYVWVGRKKAPSSGPMRRTPLQFDHLSGFET